MAGVITTLVTSHGLVTSATGIAASGTGKYFGIDGSGNLGFFTYSAGAGGTVTSVGLSTPSQFGVSGSPVTGSGTLGFAWQNQSANLVLAGPTSGGAAAPTFRALVAADLPAGVALPSIGPDAWKLRSNGTSPLWEPGDITYARVAAAVNVNVSSPGALIDGVVLANGDRVLLTAQTTASQNGLWVWDTATSAMYRPNDYPNGQAFNLQ